jgi:hypothetical protein
VSSAAFSPDGKHIVTASAEARGISKSQDLKTFDLRLWPLMT